MFCEFLLKVVDYSWASFMWYSNPHFSMIVQGSYPWKLFCNWHESCEKLDLGNTW